MDNYKIQAEEEKMIENFNNQQNGVEPVPEVEEETNTTEIVNKPSKYRLSQDFPKLSGTEKVPSIPSIRKPTRNEFIRISPELDDLYYAAILEVKNGLNTSSYLLNPEVVEAIPNEIKNCILHLAVNRVGAYFIWPLKISTGRNNRWNDTALGAAELAKNTWVRMLPNLELGEYEIIKATADIPDPVWPNKSIDDFVEQAFNGMTIDTLDHRELKKLRGEI